MLICLHYFLLFNAAAPLLMRASLPHVMTLSSKVGDNIQLNCLSDGEPRPDISWYKYNIPLSDITYRRLEDTVKFGKLFLSKILLADAGNYSCHVNGSINRTFILNVHGELIYDTNVKILLAYLAIVS